MSVKAAVNIRDIAREAGVSVASVSRALQPAAGRKLGEETRARILEVCERLNYQPNELFRRMRRGRANTVAFLFPCQEHESSDDGGFESYMDMNMAASIGGAQSFLAAHEIDVLLLEATPACVSSKRYLKMIRGQLLDGVLIWGITYEAPYVEEILGEGIPVVLIQTEDERYKCSKVVSDEYRGMYALVEKVLAAGHRRIAVLNAPESSSGGVQRVNGVRDALAAHGIIPAYVSGTGDYIYQFGYAEALRLMAHAPDASCVICSCNAVAFGCIAALKERGKDVPGDVSVVGGGGINLPGIMYELDSFFCPAREIGRKGAELLLGHMNGSMKTERVVVPVSPINGKTIKNIGQSVDDKNRGS